MWPFKAQTEPSPKSAFASLVLVVQLLSDSSVFARFLQEAAADAPAVRHVWGHKGGCAVSQSWALLRSPPQEGWHQAARSPLLCQCRTTENAAEGRAGGQDLSDQMQMSPAEYS